MAEERGRGGGQGRANEEEEGRGGNMTEFQSFSKFWNC